MQILFTVVEFTHSCKTSRAYQSQWSSGQKESNQSQVSEKKHLSVIIIVRNFYITSQLFSFPSIRLTDPVPTLETSIAPRQRPKAGQAQPQPISGILPIQPALTPRKRPSATGAPQAIGISSSVIPLCVNSHSDILYWTQQSEPLKNLTLKPVKGLYSQWFN